MIVEPNRKNKYSSLLAGAQWKAFYYIYYGPPNFLFFSIKSFFFPLPCGNWHMAYHSCRPWISILCWSQINSSWLKKYLAVHFFHVNRSIVSKADTWDFFFFFSGFFFFFFFFLILKTFHLKPADTFLYLDANYKQVRMQTPLPLKLRHKAAHTPQAKDLWTSVCLQHSPLPLFALFFKGNVVTCFSTNVSLDHWKVL